MIKILLVSILMLSVSGFADSHIFLLAGQSNIHRMDPETGFIPELKKVLPEGKIKYVKLAQSGNPIRMWVKGWENLPELTLQNWRNLKILKLLAGIFRLLSTK